MSKELSVPFIAHQNFPSDLYSAIFWQDKELIRSLYDPWLQAHPKGTLFSAIHDETAIYFHFKVLVDGYHAQQTADERLAVAGSDRVEIFFKKDDQMSPYYCLEVDYLGRCLDYKANYHRQMDFDYRWPNGLKVQAQDLPESYQVIISIQKTLLVKLGLLQNSQVQIGVFQATYFKKNETQLGTNWYSWVDPTTLKPDFHVPSAFGVLELV